MTTVTKESLAARIAELEVGPRSIKEDFQLMALRELQERREQDEPKDLTWSEMCDAEEHEHGARRRKDNQ